MTASAAGRDGFVREIVDVDCCRATPKEIARIRTLLFEHRVLVIRDQRLTPGEYQRFMESLGTPIPHVLQNLTVEGFPAILKISDYVQPDGTPSGVLDGGSYWHSDMSYLPTLGIATSLYAVRATSSSGGTSFLDLIEGWRLVSQDRDVLGLLGCTNPNDALDVEVVHRFGNRHALTNAAAATQRLAAAQRDTLAPTRHRLVERHPVTRCPGLFATSGSAMELVGLDPEKSTHALNRLEEALLARLEIYTHRYQPGDLVIWDNMSTMHRGVGVRPTRDMRHSRLLFRINVNYAGGNA
jgi:taurine dioxygenase